MVSAAGCGSNRTGSNPTSANDFLYLIGEGSSVNPGEDRPASYVVCRALPSAVNPGEDRGPLIWCVERQTGVRQ